MSSTLELTILFLHFHIRKPGVLLSGGQLSGSVPKIIFYLLSLSYKFTFTPRLYGFLCFVDRSSVSPNRRWRTSCPVCPTAQISSLSNIIHRLCNFLMFLWSMDNQINLTQVSSITTYSIFVLGWVSQNYKWHFIKHTVRTSIEKHIHFHQILPVSFRFGFRFPWHSAKFSPLSLLDFYDQCCPVPPPNN